jgi:hypothetical protein
MRHAQGCLAADEALPRITLTLQAGYSLRQAVSLAAICATWRPW